MLPPRVVHRGHALDGVALWRGVDDGLVEALGYASAVAVKEGGAGNIELPCRFVLASVFSDGINGFLHLFDGEADVGHLLPLPEVQSLRENPDAAKHDG